MREVFAWGLACAGLLLFLNEYWYNVFLRRALEQQFVSHRETLDGWRETLDLWASEEKG